MQLPFNLPREIML